MRIRKSLLALTAAGVVFCSGYSLLYAAFTPPPTVAPPPVLFSGTIEQAGIPVEGSHSIAFELWRNTDTSVSANRVCQIPAQALTLNAGLFELPLAAACGDALGRNNHVWYRLTVDGTVFPLVQVTATPVALRSAREEQDGARLRVRRRYQISADGARIPAGVSVLDTQRGNEECQNTTVVEGGALRTRCLPTSIFQGGPTPIPPGSTLYLDPGCTQLTTGLYVAGLSSPPPSYFLAPGMVGSQDAALYPLLGSNNVSIYANVGAQCAGPFSAVELLLGSQIPLTDFVELQAVVE